MKTIIVDDNEENRYLLESLLKADGHDVQSVANGVEAMERLNADRFDLIISDILMPVMDGFHLCRRVKSDESLRDTPFIFYTATYTGPQDEAFAMKIGADRFIQKPCEPDVLLEAVRDVLAAEKHSGSAPELELAGEEESLELYNERLIRKLEQKMLQLEKEVQIRRDAEEALAKSEQKYRMLAENTLDVIWAMNLELTFTYVNPAVRTLLGYTPEEWIGSQLSDHCDIETFEKMTQVIADEIAKGPEGTGVILETVLLNKDGLPIHVEVHGRVVFNENHTPVHLQGVARDISERKRAEKERNELSSQLLQAQKLESIGNLAGGIAHDFNNILSVVLGFTELAMDGTEKGSNIERYLQEIYSAGIRAKGLVDQILTFARKSEEEIKPINAKSITIEALKFLRSTIPTTIEIQQTLATDSLIMGNPTQLHQILMNLCTNAVHSMEKGGTLAIGLEDVKIEGSNTIRRLKLKPGDYIKLTVSDTGSGIPPDEIGSLFEPYYTTKEPGEGTGLGLSVVHGIVESYGGTIEIESELGEGTVFSVYLPIIETDITQHVYEKDELLGGSERVLFIDDEVSITKMGAQILGRLGYSVTTRCSAVEALELFRLKSNDFDIVITDTTMPQMSGDKLASELIRIRSDIPIVLCTGFSKQISDETASEIGIRAIAYKPIIKSDLAKTVRKVLDEAKPKI